MNMKDCNMDPTCFEQSKNDCPYISIHLLERSGRLMGLNGALLYL